MAHSRTPPFRRRRQWYTLLPVLGLLSSLWLPIAHAAKSAADYYIHDLPGAPAEPKLDMWAGHIEILPEHHGNLFFWLVNNRHIANRQRLVIWLNGGPGCSSMDGALMEIGPYRVNKDGTLKLQDGSWDEFANILFIDQPVGTGFSYVDGDSYVHEMDQMADQLISFLTSFFAIFPAYEHDDIYIAGESYAGQWIPYIGQAILERNSRNSNMPHWNLSGLLIGNGWISGPDQYISYIPFAHETGVLTPGSPADVAAKRLQEKCDAALKAGAGDKVDTNTCEQVMQEILRQTQNDGCVNMYDVRLRDTYPSCGMNWPPDLEYVKPYLRRNDVKRALHINDDKKTGWVECNGQVSMSFWARTSKPSVTLLPSLLEQVPILLFSGDQDLICNHIGTENLINNLMWNGAKGMEISPGMTAPRRDWTFEGEPAGQYQTARNLTYLRFYNSSHMVPFDYPRRTRDMLDRFIGVDIASIGGNPADSRIDGEKGLEVSVGGHPNSTVAEEEEQQKLQAAAWAAYRRSGEVALFFVVVAAGCFGYFVWRGRRRMKGYAGVLGSDPYDGRPGASRYLSSDGLGLNESRDVEAAREYNEAELDDLHANGQSKEKDRDHFALDDEDDDDEDDDPTFRARANGHTS